MRIRRTFRFSVVMSVLFTTPPASNWGLPPLVGDVIVAGATGCSACEGGSVCLDCTWLSLGTGSSSVGVMDSLTTGCGFAVELSSGDSTGSFVNGDSDASFSVSRMLTC